MARRLALAFVDSDAAIEQRLGCSIRAYFERQGEAAFRTTECDVLAELVRTEDGVISTGGGAVLNGSTRERLRTNTTCIYLHSTPEDLARRLRHDTRRPLLQVADPLARLRDLFGQRDPLYREVAHFVIETGRPSVPTLVNMIVMQLELAGVIAPRTER